MVNKHMNRCSTLLIGKCKSKTQYRVVYMSTRIAKKKNTKKPPPNSGKDVEKWSVQFAGGSAKCYNRFRKQSQFSSVHSVMSDFATPWTAARQVSLSITKSGSLLKLTSVESVMPSNHLILYHPLLLPPSIFPSIRVFSNESVLPIRWPKYWGVSPSASVLPMNIQDWFPLGWAGWISLKSKDSQESFPTLQFKSIDSLVLSFL